MNARLADVKSCLMLEANVIASEVSWCVVDMIQLISDYYVSFIGQRFELCLFGFDRNSIARFAAYLCSRNDATRIVKHRSSIINNDACGQSDHHILSCNR
jgi:hypothetical protein